MMRYGFTTGSCAAAASKAAAYMLLTGKLKQNITIQTPKGILFQTEILEITRSETEVTCAVRKDGGDDPDITSGTLIFSTVRFADGEKKIPGQNNRQFSGIHVKAMQEKRAVICIDGGKGVGRVTKPGLDQPVGNAAINHVPREMIEKRCGKSVRSRMKRQIFWWKFPCRRGRRLRHRRLIRDLASQAEYPSLGRAVLWSR